MNDKELLELAAKASGISIDYSTTNGGGVNNTGFDVSGNAVLDWHTNKTWNPLTDDGDKWRLAKHLQLIVDFGDDIVRVGNTEDGMLKTWLAHDKDDGYAIVRAAAEIGKTLWTTDTGDG